MSAELWDQPRRQVEIKKAEPGGGVALREQIRMWAGEL